MQRDTIPTRVHVLLQRAGLSVSVPGTTQLLNGQPLSDPDDRVRLARLLASAPGSAGAAKESLVIQALSD